MVQKLYRKLLPAQILSGVSMALCNQIDAMLISLFLNVSAVTAYGLFLPMSMLLMLFAGLFSTGISAVCARYFGMGDRERINANYASSLTFGAAVSAALCALCFFGAEPLAVFFGAEPGSEVARLFRDYCKAYALGIPFYILLQALTPYLHLVGKRSLVTVSVIIVTVVDVALDVLSGIFHWGMSGIAYASAAGYVCGLIPVAVFLFRKSAPISFRLKNIRLSELRATAVSGMPFAIDQCSFTVLAYFANQLLLKYSGPDAVAAYAVVNTLGALLFSVYSSAGNSGRILSGIFYGEESREILVKVIRVGLVIAVIMGGAFTLLCEVLAEPLVAICLNDSSHAAGLAVLNLRYYAFAFPITASTYLLRSYYQSTGRSGLSQVMSALTAGILPLLFAFAAAPMLSAVAVWVMIPVTQLLSLFIHFVIASIYRKKPTFSVQALAMLPPDFGFPEDAVLGTRITSYADAVAVSRQTAEFCRAHGQSSSFANLTALCAEELTVFLLRQHEGEKGTHEIFFRVAAKEDKWILQLRDDYDSFDFAEYIRLHHADDSISHLGIRIVSGRAKEATYINALGCNSLLLRLQQAAE